MKTKYMIVGLFLGCLPNESFAEYGWFIRNAEIVDISSFYDGTYMALQLQFRANPVDVDEGNLGSSCPPTWEQGTTTGTDIKIVTWGETSNPNSTSQLMYSTALSAQAQGLPVDLLIDTGSCFNGPNRFWGYKWRGARISSQ